MLALPNGFLASASWDKSIKIWNINSGNLVYTFNSSNGGHSDWVLPLAYLSNGYLASGSFDNTVKIWNLRTGRLVFTFDEKKDVHIKNVNTLVALHDGLFASGSDDTTIRVWNTTTGTLKGIFGSDNGGHTDWVSCLAFVKSKFYLASGSWDQTVRIFNVKNGKLVYTFNHTSIVSALSVLSNDNLAVSTFDGQIYIYNLNTGVLLTKFLQFIIYRGHN